MDSALFWELVRSSRNSETKNLRVRILSLASISMKRGYTIWPSTAPVGLEVHLALELCSFVRQARGTQRDLWCCWS